MSNIVTFTTEQLRQSQEKLLNRMAELRLVSHYGWNDATGAAVIKWTDDGRRILGPVRIALDHLGCRTADELCALEGILNGMLCDPSA
jgi:hypothetical protein